LDNHNQAAVPWCGFFCFVSTTAACWTGFIQMRSVLLRILTTGAFNCFNVRLRDVEENLTIANMFENSAVGGSFVDELD
jgi:hypothetical protein